MSPGVIPRFIGITSGSLLIMALLLIPGGGVSRATAQPMVAPVSSAASGESGMGRASDRRPVAAGPTLQREGASDYLPFERLSVEQGLPQNTVRAIFQDRQGFLWFATEEGLGRYDGYSFVTYRHDPDDPHSIGDNFVYAVYEDSMGSLWVGSETGGLDRLDRATGRFSHYRSSPDEPTGLTSDNVRCILEDRSGTLWAGTTAGASALAPGAMEFANLRGRSEVPQALSHGPVLAIHEDRTGTLWFGTADGLVAYDREGDAFSHYRHDPADPGSLSEGTVLAIHEDRDGALWVATDGGGLNVLNLERTKFEHFRANPDGLGSLGSDRLAAILEDREGQIWVGTLGAGLYRFDRANRRFFRFVHDPTDLTSLSDDYVFALHEDASGVLWVGTYAGGLSKLDRQGVQFTPFTALPGEPESPLGSVYALYEEPSQILWVGTSAGLYRIDRHTGQATRYRFDPADPGSLSHDYIRMIYRDRRGTLWVGTEGGGLNRLDPGADRFVHYRHDPQDGDSLSNDVVSSIHEDAAGNLWFGTDYGLDRFDPASGKFLHYRSEPGNENSLSDNRVWALQEGRSNTLWIGTGTGLNRLDLTSGRFNRYLHDPANQYSLSENRIIAIHEDDQGAVWVGTVAGGLNRLDPDTGMVVRYREKDGLPNDTVYAILPDQAGFLWLSTNRGLSRFDPRAETFRNFDHASGLQSSEFNWGAHFKSDSGELYFGGVNGFNAFLPENITANDYVPPIALTSLTQGYEPARDIPAAADLREATFAWPGNYFEFEFAALSFVRPEKNRYAYMLEGFDHDWNYIGTRRTGSYTNLPGGTYALRLKGANNDGVWNEEGLSIKITIVPPFWETWWFRGALLFTLFGGVAMGYRFRVRSVEARSRELAAQVEQRTRALAQRTRELERRREVAEGLREILIILNSDRPLKESLDCIISRALQLLAADLAVVFRCDQNGELTTIAAGWQGQAGETYGKGLPKLALEWIRDRILEARPLITSSVHGPLVQQPGDGKQGAAAYRALLAVPLLVGGEPYGGIALIYARERSFAEEEVQLALTLADQAALAIANARLRERAEEVAVAGERSRIARDLHDAVSQTLFSASLIAEVLPGLWENDQVEGQQLLQELRQLTRGAQAEMRALLLELRPAAIVEASLGDLLRQLVEAAAGRTGVPVTLSVEGRCDLPPDVHISLYRIAQEALNNVVKHARASHVGVSLRCPSSEQPEDAARDGTRAAALEVVDDGRGFDPGTTAPDSLGLGIMRERAQAIAAILEIDSQPGCGTRIRVAWKE